MRLLTLGTLSLEGSDFSRSKPLLLLTFLSLAEGALERRHVAELFWQGKSDHLNSLSSALNQLRSSVVGSVDADEARVWTGLRSDAHELLVAFDAKDFARVVALYEGPFLETVNASRLGEELESWVLETREALAFRVQEALLQLAELKATKALFSEAASLAERAFKLAGALEPEPEQLGRYFVLLVAGGHPFAEVVHDEASAFGISLSLSQEDAKARLQMVLIGRDVELARLSSLDAGTWLWLQGSSGIGKTALLKALSSSNGAGALYLQARKGLPYITLEPYVADVLSEGKEAMLRKLLFTKGFWLTDAWELMDAESQELLERLRDLRPELTLVIASQEQAKLSTDATLELKPLSKEDLAAYEGAFESTGGVPALLAAYLKGETLDAVLSSKLSRVSTEAKHLYLCLALTDNAELSTLRKALGLDAAGFANALEDLLKASLINANYTPIAKQAAQQYLEAHPVEASQLALQLARQLKGADAYPLYQQTQSFWTKEDLAAVKDAYYAWAAELLKRGFPQRAANVLNNCPEPDEKVNILKARALNRTGQNSEALELLSECTKTPEVLALSAMVHWRLGMVEIAQEQATLALKGDTRAKASSENVLGHIAFAKGDYETAKKHFKKSAVFWQILGEKGLWAYALNNEASANYQLGKPIEAAYQKALRASEDNPMVQCRILNNLAVLYDEKGQAKLAEEMIRQAIDLSHEVGSLISSAESWNNLGAFQFDWGKPDDALESYRKALELAQEAEDTSLVALAMANQSEVTGDLDTLETAIELLQSTGHLAEATEFIKLLPEGHALQNI